MDKEEFQAILQCAMFAFEGSTLENLMAQGYDKNIALAGIKLSEYLKSLEVGSND